LGYDIVGLPIAGLQRRLDPANLLVPWKMLRSAQKARSIIRDFSADVVVGFGGYASAPVLWAAQRMGVATVIQEQNSYAGVTNKLLARSARRICVAYDDMERFFPADRIILTGNPLRGSFAPVKGKSDEALAHYGLRGDVPTVMVVGGSLGTRTLNEMMKSWILSLDGEAPVQVLWQTGKYYEAEMREFLAQHPTKNIWQGAFIERMDYAYEVADVVISRSGACTVSELCLVGKPTIFVPSPNVAEDHQTKNAMALAEKSAALVVPDREAVAKGMGVALQLLEDKEQLQQLAKNIAKLGIKDSAERVVRQIEKEW
jgi:UDP-N-acetylglucosamine--N-acetylmuramyl-(pentapeptide) pyrophosphoryl-undecaprenol N-acetylglucosamine transferase